jgi:hypothetical protein
MQLWLLDHLPTLVPHMLPYMSIRTKDSSVKTIKTNPINRLPFCHFFLSKNDLWYMSFMRVRDYHIEELTCRTSPHWLMHANHLAHLLPQINETRLNHIEMISQLTSQNASIWTQTTENYSCSYPHLIPTFFHPSTPPTFIFHIQLEQQRLIVQRNANISVIVGTKMTMNAYIRGNPYQCQCLPAMRSQLTSTPAQKP